MADPNLFTGVPVSRMPYAQKMMSEHATSVVMIMGVLVLMVMFLAYYAWKHKPKDVPDAVTDAVASGFRHGRNYGRNKHHNDNFLAYASEIPMTPAQKQQELQELKLQGLAQQGLLGLDYSSSNGFNPLQSPQDSACAIAGISRRSTLGGRQAATQATALGELSGYQQSVAEGQFQSMVGNETADLYNYAGETGLVDLVQ